MTALAELSGTYQDAVDFYFVYTSEAHPNQDEWLEAAGDEARWKRAAEFEQLYDPGMPVLVDPVGYELGKKMDLDEWGFLVLGPSGRVEFNFPGSETGEAVNELRRFLKQNVATPMNGDLRPTGQSTSP